jgi:hypothetical protein
MLANARDAGIGNIGWTFPHFVPPPLPFAQADHRAGYE